MAQLGDSRANEKHAKALATREEEQHRGWPLPCLLEGV